MRGRIVVSFATEKPVDREVLERVARRAEDSARIALGMHGRPALFVTGLAVTTPDGPVEGAEAKAPDAPTRTVTREITRGPSKLDTALWFLGYTLLFLGVFLIGAYVGH